MRTARLHFIVSILNAAMLSSLVGCGHHSSENKYSDNTEGFVKGSAPDTLEEKMETAIDQNNLPELLALMDDPQKVDTRLGNGDTLLIHATKQTKYKIMVKLVALGADISLLDSSGKSALDYAAIYDETGSPKYNRAWVILDPELQLKLRADLIKFTTRGSADAIINILKEVGVNPNFVDENTGETPLTLAVVKRKKISVQALASWRDCPDENNCLNITQIDIAMPRRDGLTALSIAEKMAEHDIGNPLTIMKEIIAILKNNLPTVSLIPNNKGKI